MDWIGLWVDVTDKTAMHWIGLWVNVTDETVMDWVYVRENVAVTVIIAVTCKR